MSSDYFDSADHQQVAATRARASAINNALDAIDTGFALLPTEDDIKKGLTNYGIDSGAADAYVVTLPNTAATFLDGMQVVFKASAANTGACTVNVDSLGAKSITRHDGTTPVAGDIGADKITELRYNSTSDKFEIQGNIGVAAGAGTLSAQNANAVDIVGGTIKGITAEADAGAVVTVGGTQTLTAKTLTSPKINEDVALLATSTEINSGVDGMGVTIPRQKVIEIGNWDMDATEAVAVAHGVTGTIVGCRAIIRNDGDTARYVLTEISSAGAPSNQGGIASIGASVSLHRVGAGIFDDTAFDTAVYNRGWIIVDYID